MRGTCRATVRRGSASCATAFPAVITREPAPTQPTVAHRVGMWVLQTTQFYAVPEMVAVEVAAIKADKSMLVNDRVVLLDPATSEEVAE